MQGLDHAHITYLIQAQMTKKEMRIRELSRLANVKFETLARVMGGQAPYTVQIMAGIGLALGQDFSQIWAQHSLVQYHRAHVAALAGPIPEERKVPNGNEFTQIVQQVAAFGIASGTTTDLLIQQICGLTAVPVDMARQELLLVHRDMQNIENLEGDYGHEHRQQGG